MVQNWCFNKSWVKYFLPYNFIVLFIGLIVFSHSVLAQDWIYTVRPGDSLWQISKDNLISPEHWIKVQKLNDIDKTDQLAPGTRLTIPVEWLKQQPATASIVSLRGQVELIREKKQITLSPDQTLYLGDRIRTGKNSSISIKFNDNSMVIVFPDSEIYLATLEAKKSDKLIRTTINVIHGRIENKVMQQKEGSRYQINTPAAVAAVRGTEFRISVENNGEVMFSEVLVGAVGVSGSGITQHVTAGYATFAKVGSPPVAPIELPAAPDLSSLSKRTTAQSVTYQWPMLTHVSHYRAQLAMDNLFTQLVSESLLDIPQVTWTALTPSTYFMRVRGIDKLGIEGFDAQHQFIVNEPPQTPSALTPREAVKLSNRRPFIAWSSIEGASSYRLQLASDQKFKQNLSEISGLVNNNFKPVDALALGQYYWRVQSVSGSRDKSEFSDVRSFTVELAD